MDDNKREQAESESPSVQNRLRKFIGGNTPRALKKLLRNWFVTFSNRGRRRRCPVCGDEVSNFTPLPDYYAEQMEKFGCIHSILEFETLSISEYQCPKCGASDRDRLYAIYINQKHEGLGIGRELSFVDFAPSASLSAFIRSLPSVRYRSADLYSQFADDKLDLTDMRMYRTSSFDAFLCSHVLEHVSDDRKAIGELFRILKPGGWGIVMVPIPLELDLTLEDPAHTSEAERWRYYGQFDHVRIYSKRDFVARLEGAGFRVNQLGLGYFGEDNLTLNGISPRSVLYVVEKHGSPELSASGALC